MEKNNLRNRFTLFASILLILLFFIVSAGWIFNIQVLKGGIFFGTPMSMNSAISTLLMGFSLLALRTGRHAFTRTLAVLTSLCAIYFFFQCLGVVHEPLEVNFKPFCSSPKQTLFMSIAFLMASSGLLLVTYSKSGACQMIALFIGSILIVLPLVTLLEFVVRLTYVDQLLGFSPESYQSVLALLAIGLVLNLWALSQGIAEPMLIVVLPSAAVLAVVIATVEIFDLYRQFEIMQLRAVAAHELKIYQNSVEDLLENDILALERMADRFEQFDPIPEKLWTHDVNNFLRDIPELLSLQLINEKNEIVRKQFLSPLQLSPSKEEIEAVRKRGKEGRSRLLYVPELEVVRLLIPIKTGGAFPRALFAEFSVDAILEQPSELELITTQEFDLIVLFENDVVFRNSKTHSPQFGLPIESRLSQELLPLDLVLFLTEASLRRFTSNFGAFIIIVGMVVAGCIAALLYLAVTNRHKTERLADLNRTLEVTQQQTEELASAKGSFMAIMSHEIRAPLNSIVGTSELLLETECTPKQQKYVNRIQSSCDDLLSLISNILDFSKIEAHRLQLQNTSCDVVKLMQELAETFESQIEAKKLKLFLDFPPQPIPQIVLDAFRIKQIVRNYMTNAIKFTDDGYIVIKLEFMTGQLGPPLLRCSIQDTGIGIAQEELKELFREYKQADVLHSREKGGVGLGLSITNKLVEMMGGRIGCESKSGQGSTFFFEIPAVIDVTAKKAEMRTLKMGIVLLQVDHPIERALIQKSLEAWGIQTAETKSTSCCFALIERQYVDRVKGELPFLIIGEGQLTRPLRASQLFEALSNRVNEQ